MGYNSLDRPGVLPAMSIKFQNELLLINILTAALIIIIAFFPDSIWRVVLGLPLLLFFPGYTFLAALIPRKDEPGKIERLALGPGPVYRPGLPDRPGA